MESVSPDAALDPTATGDAILATESTGKEMIDTSAPDQVVTTDGYDNMEIDKTPEPSPTDKVQEPEANANAGDDDEPSHNLEFKWQDNAIHRSIAAKEGQGAEFSKVLHAYVKVNGVPINTPQAWEATYVTARTSSSLDCVAFVNSHPGDYASVQIKLFGHKLGLSDESLGHLLIWARDIVDCTGNKIEGEKDTIAILRDYCKDVKNAPERVLVIKIKASAVQMAIPFGVGAALRTAVHGGVIKSGIQMAEKLKQVRSAIATATDGSVELELLFAAGQDSQLEDVVQFHSQVTYCSHSDKECDPLEQYFQHSPGARVLTLGHCPEPGSPEFPEITNGIRVLQFADKHQHLVSHMYGSVYDDYLECAYVESLRGQEFMANLLPMRHVDGHRRFLCLVDPNGQEALLPKYGDRCRIKFPYEQSTNEADDDTIHGLAVAMRLALTESQSEQNYLDFVNGELIGKITRALEEEEYAMLQPSPEEREDRDDSPFTNRLFAWLQDHRDFVQPRENDLSEVWFGASRMDIPSPCIPPHLQAYLVWMPKTKDKSDTSAEPRTADTPLLDLTALAFAAEEKSADYFARLLSEDNAKCIVIRRDHSSKTIKAEALAINDLHYPRAAQPPPSSRSLAAYRYLLDFNEKEAPTVNLLKEIPGIGNVVIDEDDTAPTFLRDRFEARDRSTQQTFLSFAALPAGVSLTGGVAGCGKSAMLEDAILYAQYGQCGKDTEPAEAEPANVKILYLVNNNNAVETFAKRLAKTYEQLGVQSSGVVRLYPMEGEVKAMLPKDEKGKQPMAWDKQAAEDDRAALSDHFLAEYHVNEITIDVHHAYESHKKNKRRNLDVSLHAAALKFYNEHLDNPRYEAITTTLNREEQEDDATPDGTADQSRNLGEEDPFKAATTTLYHDFLEQFTGVVVTTPVAAASFAFRTAFRPHLVMMDEAATMRELCSMIGISFFSPAAWVLVGDPAQKPPYIREQHDLGNGKTSANPFKEILGISTLGRAVEAGKANAYLRTNYRSFGNLPRIPNALCYRYVMRQKYTKEAAWPEAATKMVEHLKTINPAHPSGHSRMLVEFSGAKTTKIASSTANLTHVQWTLQQIKAIINNNEILGLGHNAGNPADILIIPYYNAQVLEYQRRIKDMINTGELPRDVDDRVKVRTLDSAQGDESDIVIADLVQVSYPGFIAEPYRTTLATTRARGMCVLLLNRGTFVGHNKKSVWQRAEHLFRLYRLHEKDNLVLRIECCDNCASPNHKTKACTELPADYSDFQCERDSCSQMGHHTLDCPAQLCRNCQQEGHNANVCLAPFTCSNCTGEGHLCFDCTKPATKKAARGDPNAACHLCNQEGHFAARCPTNVTCKRCNETGHMAADCPKPRDHNVTCNHCRQMGHKARNCPERVCKNCQEKGHTAADCPQVVYKRSAMTSFDPNKQYSVIKVKTAKEMERWTRYYAFIGKEMPGNIVQVGETSAQGALAEYTGSGDNVWGGGRHEVSAKQDLGGVDDQRGPMDTNLTEGQGSTTWGAGADTSEDQGQW